MTRTQKQDVHALQQRNQELAPLLQEANLLILALHTMIEVAEQELKIPIRGNVWHQTVSRLKSYDLAQVRVGRLCRLFGVSRHAFYRKEQ